MNQVTQYKRPYLDSSCYIAAINKEAGRVDAVEAVLAAADRADIEIVASTFVAAEVIKMKGQTGFLSTEREAAIDTILRNPRILWVELDLARAVQARHLARDHSLKPGDAVHLASAIHGRADVLFRYDDRFTVNSALAGLEVCEPYWYGTPPLPGIRT